MAKFFVNRILLFGRKKTNGQALLMVMGLVVCLCFSVCAKNAAAGSQSCLVIGVGRDFYDGPDSRSYLHGSTNTWEALTYLDKNMRPKPWLAESWQSFDHGKTWVFNLRKNVKFHDLSGMTASDVVASIERIKKNPKYDPTGNWRNLKTVTAKGKYKVVLTLKKPCLNLPNLVAYYSSPILKKGTYDEKGRIKRLVATGPFKPKKIIPSQSIELEAFKEYWGEKPCYQKVVFKSILDANTRLLALMAGEVDVLADVGAILPEQAFELKGLPYIKTKKQQVATTHYLVFNCSKEPFSKREHRHWLANIVNRKQMVQVLAKGVGILAKWPFTPLAKDWIYDGLEFEKGVKPKPGSKKLTMICHSGTLERWPYLAMAQVLQEKLKANGLPSRIKVLEPGAYYEAFKKGEFDMALQPNTLMTGDPDFFYAYYLAKDGYRNTGCKDDKADELILKARVSKDFNERQKIYGLLEKRFSYLLPVLPLYHDVSLYGYGPKVASFEMDHNFRPSLIKAKPKKQN